MTHKKKSAIKQDIVFPLNKEMQELGFTNTYLAWDEKYDSYVLFTTYHWVIIPSEQQEKQVTLG
jgi:hypothetical protein